MRARSDVCAKRYKLLPHFLPAALAAMRPRRRGPAERVVIVGMRPLTAARRMAFSSKYGSGP